MDGFEREHKRQAKVGSKEKIHLRADSHAD